MTKKHGKHIFIKTKKPLKEIGYSGKPVLIFEDPISQNDGIQVSMVKKSLN